LHTQLLLRTLSLALLSTFLLTACSPVLTPTNAPPNSTPVPPTPVQSPTPAPSPTPSPIELIICQSDEPSSLYFYGDNSPARAGIFEALFDGPIDSVNYAYQPVILERLPSLENGEATLSEVTVNPGDKVVDVATGAITDLAEGVQLLQLDGSRLTYSGKNQALTVQVSATFNLKADLHWSDGQPLNADDSLFSFEIASSPDTHTSKFILDRTARYEIVTPLSTRWTGLPGWLDNNFFLRFWTPLPRHLYGRFSAAELITNAEATERPLGWGAFMVSEWIKGDHLTLVRNPNYFRAAEGLPKLDEVTFRFGLDSDKVIAELLAGRCDIGAEEADFAGQISFLQEAQQNGLLAPQFVTSNTFEHLDFGIETADDYERGAGNKLFQDARVRHAIAYCLDRPAIIDQLFNGLSEVPAVYISSTHPLYSPDVVVYPFDPAQGQALLEEAGWVDKNGDGVRENGRRLLKLDYASGPPGSVFRETLMRLVQSQLLNNCGIDLNLKLYSVEELTNPWPNGVLFGKKFDLGEFPWRTGIEPPCDLYLTEAIPSGQNPGGVNNTGYSNPAFDQACLAALNALDEATRKAKHAEAEVIFSQDLPSLPLFLRLKVGVALPRVKDYQVDSTANSDLWNIEAISLAIP
jgi:peptide/nickel transport system substrate-binding protein